MAVTAFEKSSIVPEKDKKSLFDVIDDAPKRTLFAHSDWFLLKQSLVGSIYFIESYFFVRSVQCFFSWKLTD